MNNTDNDLMVRLNQNQWEDVRVFFESTYKGNYAFRVYLAQKAFNINEIVYHDYLNELLEADLKEKAEELRKLRETTFLSQTGLVLQAEQLANHYIEYGSFQQILVSDELMLTGRDLSKTFYTLEEAICRSWETKKEHKLHSDEYLKLRSALLSAIEFRAYIMDDRGLLVESVLQARVRTKERHSFNRCFRFARDVSNLVLFSESVESTSFYPSFYFSKEEFSAMSKQLQASGEWQEYLVEPVYGEKIRVFQWHQVGERSFYAAFCCRKTGKKVVLTPYVLFDKLSDSRKLQLFEVVRSFLQRFDTKKLIDILERHETKNHLRIKIQLISSILSIALFYNRLIDFRFRSNDSEKCFHNGGKNNDLEKIALYYGLISDFYNDFLKICSNQDRARSLRSKLIDTVFQPIPIDRSDESKMLQRLPMQTDETTTLCDRFLLQLEYNELERNKLRRAQDVFFTPWSSYTMEQEGSLIRYLDGNTVYDANSGEKIAVLLAFAQCGFAGIRTCDSQDSAFYINVGEATATLAFRALRGKLGVLKLLENWCAENGLATVSWAVRFGRYLDMADTTHPNKHWENLFREKVGGIYQCGLRLRDWVKDTMVREDDDDSNDDASGKEMQAFIQAVREGRA